MKKLLTFIMALTFVVCWAGAGWSATIKLMHDYGLEKYHPTNGDGPLKKDAVILKDWNDSRFADEFDLSNYRIDSKKLTLKIKHKGNGSSECGANCFTEKWHFMAYSSEGAGNDPYYNESTKRIPCLDNSIDWLSFSGDGWVVDKFKIKAEDVKITPLRLLFAEETCGKDKLKIDYIQLSFKGSEVPVPAAVWLLGSGLVGLFGFRKRMKG